MARKWKEKGCSQAVLEVNEPSDDGKKKVSEDQEDVFYYRVS